MITTLTFPDSKLLDCEIKLSGGRGGGGNYSCVGISDMSVSLPLRCVFALSKQSARTSLRRTFHSSRHLRSRPPPKHQNIKASDLGLVKQQDDTLPPITTQHFPAYTEAEKATLAKRYTPAQLAAIEAGEAAVDPNDLLEQGAIREDPMRLPYIDDLSEIHPVVDKQIRAPEENYDPNLRFKTEDELVDDLVNWVANDMPEKPTRLDWMKFLDNTRLTVGKPEAELNPVSYVAPDIPKLDILMPRTLDEEEIDPATRRLMRQTGFSNDEIKRFKTKILVTHRVVNQTRLGKIQSEYYLAVAGNGRGLLGIGEGKSAEIEDARAQARNAAIRNMQPIPMYEARTIHGDVKGKVSATEVELSSRPPGMPISISTHPTSSLPPFFSGIYHPLNHELMNSSGFGIRCQSLIWEMCRCAGIQDLSAKVTRSRNKMNTIKATLQALLSQRLPDEEARARGRKLVDVRKVYYNGNV